MLYKLNGKILKGQFTLNGIKYPSNWLSLSLDEDILALGITIEPELIVEITSETQEEELPRELTIADQFVQIQADIQIEIDKKAEQLGFSQGNSLMLYAGFPNVYQELAQQFATWEVSVWVEAEAYKQDILNGTNSMITAEEAVAMMPLDDAIVAVKDAYPKTGETL